MTSPQAVRWREVRSTDATASTAFACGDPEVEHIAGSLFVPCHRAIHQNVGPWACFVLERIGNADIVAIGAIEQRCLLSPLYEHQGTYIPAIAVADSYQGMGYSRMLMNNVLNEARQQRGDYVWAEVSETNARAQQLFANNLFERCPIRFIGQPNATHAMWWRDK